MTKCRQVSLPDMGSHLKCTPKKMIKIRPNQNEGIAWPMTEIDSAILSIQVLGRMAANMPKGMDRIMANDRAQMPKVMVTPMRSLIICATG